MSRILPALLVVAAALAAFTIASPMAAADAPVPTHQVGDKVGFGATMDIGMLAEPALAYIRMIDSTDANITINRLNLTGSSDIWATMEVVGKTTDSYSIRTDQAVGLQIDYVVDVTSTQFPQAGTYLGDMSSGFCVPPTIPVTTETVFAEEHIDLLSTSTGLSTWTISNFAVQEAGTNTSFELRVTSTTKNFPSTAFNVTACEFTVTYKDMDVTLTANVDLDLQTSYSPALDYFGFPISDGENWTANSSAIEGGRVRGTIDVVGIDPQDEADFFQALNQALEASGLSVSGLDGFPVILENVTIMLGLTPYLKDGVIHDIPSEINLSLHARERTMTLADGNFHTVYLISENTAAPYGLSCGWIYSPDDGFIVGYVCEIADGVSVFELKNVPDGTATGNIAETKQKYVVFASPTSALGDFFLKAPFFGILIIAAVAILGVALLMRLRRKPGMAPPSGPPNLPPPPMPPPQGPPPGPP